MPDSGSVRVYLRRREWREPRLCAGSGRPPAAPRSRPKERGSDRGTRPRRRVAARGDGYASGTQAASAAGPVARGQAAAAPPISRSPTTDQGAPALPLPRRSAGSTSDRRSSSFTDYGLQYSGRPAETGIPEATKRPGPVVRARRDRGGHRSDSRHRHGVMRTNADTAPTHRGRRSIPNRPAVSRKPIVFAAKRTRVSVPVLPALEAQPGRA